MRQPRNYKEWLETEGAVEHPTHLDTLQKPEHQARIQWLRFHIPSKSTVLDVGCNWGYVANLIGADTGLDINTENIDKAMREFPHIHFIQGDITQQWQFFDKQYDVVVMSEVLEHIDRFKVEFVLSEALRIARKKILITLPWRSDDKCAFCFKHKWIPTAESIGTIITLFCGAPKITIECDGVFIYMEIVK